LVRGSVLLTNLRGAVLAVDGIAAAEIESGSDRAPTVRVWLDGTRTADLVSADVKKVLEGARLHAASSAGEGGGLEVPEIGSAGDAAAAATSPDTNGGARRTGLGRGLEALIPASDPELIGANRLESVGLEESAIGTVVRAADRTGRVAVVPVEPEQSLNQAVAAAVAELSGVPGLPVVVAVEVRRIAGSPVLIAIIDHDGRRTSGSALVDSGMAYVLGRAIWSALRSLT
jgi:hypothetical protein